MLFRPHGRWSRLFVFFIAAFAVGAAHSDNATPEQEYKKLIRVNEDVQPLGEHPFGEKISLYDGALSFEQADVSVSGIGPVMQLVRHFELEGLAANPERSQYAFGDWDLDLPRIETLTADGWYYNNVTGAAHEVTGWEVDVGAQDPNARCSQFSAPPSVVMHLGDSALTPWEPSSWWKGYHLVIPGQGSQDLLSNMDSASKGLFPVVTKEHWRISCLSSTHNGMPGEGFLAQAPDGTTYRFDELVYRQARGMSRPLYSALTHVVPSNSWSRYFAGDDVIGNAIAFLTGSGDAHATTSTDVITRRVALMLVTQITDRFGNTLGFSYDDAGHLTGIAASDGRSLTIQYQAGSPLIHSVTLQPSSGEPRTWTYSYGAGSQSVTTLTGVTLPDGSNWSYDLAALDVMTLAAASPSSCLTLEAPNMAAVTGAITHPSGLKAAFTVAAMKHGRSLVPRGCDGMQTGPDDPGSYAEIPSAWYSFTLTRESLSGAGIPDASIWTYQYSPANDSWSDCTGSCPTTVYTDVVNPDGSTTRHTFSNKFDFTESQLLRTDYYAGAAGSSTLLRSEANSYAAPTTAPLPANAGGNPQANVNFDQTTKYSPLSKRVITQEGDSYTWLVEAFDSYAQVTKVRRFNSFSQDAVEEQTDYLNDTTRWVLGLPTRLTNLTTGEVVDKNVYDVGSDTLIERWHFGQKLMSYTFNAQGELASFTDGNTNTTTLGNYSRGIPQLISYPDGRSQSLVVDDFGQIQSTTDQAGATSSYGYDNVGRLTRITYPAGDEQAWYPKTLTYDFVTTAENGVAPNHWRRTVAKGNQRTVTYFDAGLRPVLTDTSICLDTTCASMGSHTWVRTDYDFRGLTTFSSYPVADTAQLTDGTTSIYDALGRITRTQQTSELGTLTTSTAYLSGARSQVTDPKGYITTTRYQVFDTPSYGAVVEVQAPTGLAQTIARDLYGNPLSMSQGGAYGTGTVSVTKTLNYDIYHRLCRTTEPESGSEVMAYDGANNLLWSAAGATISGTGCGQEQVADAAKTVRSYDPMNRVTSVAYPAGTDSATYTYTPTGAIRTAISGLASWTYAYNTLGQLTSEALDIEGYHWPVLYSHDPYGSVAMVTYPDGKQVSYAPDALGRPSKVGTYATGITYFPNGGVQYYRLGDGTEYMAEQTTRQTLGSFNYFHGADNPVVAQQYTYDPDGNLTVVDDQVDHRRDKAYGYDALNRLTSAQAANLWGTETYAYDPLNNLREVDSDGMTRTYAYNSLNQLASITNGLGSVSLHSYSYDAQGNIIQKDGASLVFDRANRLIQVVGGSRYAYDASGRRVKKTAAGGAATYYAYTSDGRLLYQFDAAAGAVTDYVYLGRQLTAEVRRNQGDLVLNPPAAIAFDANPNDGSYTATWSSAGTSTYELQESIDGGASWQGVYSGTATSKAFSGKGGGTYLYQVRACQEECTDWRASAPLGVTPSLATVSAPAGLQSTSFTVNWTRPVSATRFDVEEQKDGGTWVRLATDTLNLSIGRNNLAVGTYAYRVSSKNGYGTRGWAMASPVTVLYPPTSAPTLSAPLVSSASSYTVSWGTIAAADRYQLQEQLNAGAWSLKYEGANQTTVVSGVTNGAHYGYEVRACNAVGCGPYSATTTVAIAIPPPMPAGAYANDMTVNPKLETLTLVWQASSGATVYEIENLDTGTLVTSTTGTSAEVERGYGEPLPLHTYAVHACNAYACSAWVTAQYRQVYNPPASAPSLSAPTTSGTGSYTVSWGAVYQAVSYTLQESINGGAWATVYTGSGTSKTFSGKANASYGYRARASNSGGDGPWSAAATVSVTTVSGVTGLSATVQWLGTMSDSATSVDAAMTGKPMEPMSTGAGGELSPMMMPPPPTETYAWYVSAHWNAATNATRYDVKVTDTSSGAVSTYSVTTTSLPATQVSHSTITVQAQACNSSTCSAWSGAVTAVRQ